MTDTIFKSVKAFTPRKKKQHYTVHIIKKKSFKSWLKKQNKSVTELAKSHGFAPEDNKTLLSGTDIYSIVPDTIKLYEGAKICQSVEKLLTQDTIKKATFGFDGVTGTDAELLSIGWGLGCYSFDTYKSEKSAKPTLVLADNEKNAPVFSKVGSIYAVRDLVNIPSNDLGPEELEKVIKALAKQHDASVKVVKDQKKLEQDFPLVFTVGKASPRLPRLIELNWGNAKDPKVTLVGKGVVFDTGGLDIKPSQYMRYMKKDMGGAAHTIALAKLIMDHKLPVRLRLLVPAVENAVAGEAFRPGDIIKSRKGLFVENTNTDAEGRLILADTLTYASEGKPELIIDYATLTGSARAGLGPDIPALFSNNDKIAAKIQKTSEKAEDPVWAMPLWQPYRKHIEKSTGDLVNSAGLPGDLIYSALFLESFVDDKTDWVHLDCYAWEHSGRAGRPVGGSDTGLLTLFTYLQDRYG